MSNVIGMYTALQNQLIEEHNVVMCDGTIDGHECEHCRLSAHRCAYHKGNENRKIRNWKQENTILSTFILLHEIGHLQEHYKYRVEDEYRATEWALQKCKDLHISVSRDMVSSKQISIMRMYDKYASEYKNADLYGINKPEWLKDREYYNVVRLYDQMFRNGK